MYKILIVALTLLFLATANAQQAAKSSNQDKDALDEESEDRFLEIIRQRFEKDVGDLQKLMESRGNVDQFFEQRLKQLMSDVGQGIDQGNHNDMYTMDEKKDHYVVKPAGAIDSKIPCQIEVNQKEIHIKATMLAPYHRAVDFRVPMPHDARGSGAKVNIDPKGRVSIVIPKIKK